MIKTIENSYRRSRFFDDFFPVVKNVLEYQSDNIADFVTNSIVLISRYLSLKTKIVKTSRCYKNNNMDGVNRVVDICKRERATVYINAQGGRLLYDSKAFQEEKIQLRFLKTKLFDYKKNGAEFIPYLSIIDLLMNVGPRNAQRLFGEFDFISGD